MNRRQFLKSSAALGAGLLFVPRGIITGKAAPSDKLNVALIGVWGRARAHMGVLSEENLVALCDINENRIAEAKRRFPNAKTYVDWRKCLEQPDLDAILCCTTDHTHAFIANWSLSRDLHIFMEKPLGNTVQEARVCRENWLKKKNKL